MSARGGMTMIELVVVIALMAIIAGISAPALVSLDRPRNVSGFDAVITLLKRSRSTAIHRATIVSVTVDPAMARYWVDPPDTTDVVNLPAGATLSARASRVHFRFAPNGQVITDEPLFVREGAAVKPVLVDLWTGEVGRVSR
jgi:prepilin-type N-terminal cleavage/methylation domain-containing protein